MSRGGVIKKRNRAGGMFLSFISPTKLLCHDTSFLHVESTRAFGLILICWGEVRLNTSGSQDVYICLNTTTPRLSYIYISLSSARASVVVKTSQATPYMPILQQQHLAVHTDMLLLYQMLYWSSPPPPIQQIAMLFMYVVVWRVDHGLCFISQHE